MFGSSKNVGDVKNAALEKYDLSDVPVRVAICILEYFVSEKIGLGRVFLVSVTSAITETSWRFET